MKDAKILVVDDDPFICRLITEFLEAQGYRPTAISDGQKGVELFAARSIDLVLTDYNMPVMTGVELARRMRALKPSTPICLMASLIGEIPEQELAEFDGVLEKPLKEIELAALVSAVLPFDTGENPLVARPPRFEVDWRVDYIPLDAETLSGEMPAQRHANLRDISEHGLAFVTDQPPPSDRFCAFLIYPPESAAPSLMVGEVRWTKDQAGMKVAGTRSLFWGSEREKHGVIEQAM